MSAQGDASSATRPVSIKATDVKAEIQELEQLSVSLGGITFREFRAQMRALATAAESRRVVQAYDPATEDCGLVTHIRISSPLCSVTAAPCTVSPEDRGKRENGKGLTDASVRGEGEGDVEEARPPGTCKARPEGKNTIEPKNVQSSPPSFWSAAASALPYTRDNKWTPKKQERFKRRVMVVVGERVRAKYKDADDDHDGVVVCANADGKTFRVMFAGDKVDDAVPFYNITPLCPTTPTRACPTPASASPTHTALDNINERIPPRLPTVRQLLADAAGTEEGLTYGSLKQAGDAAACAAATEASAVTAKALGANADLEPQTVPVSLPLPVPVCCVCVSRSRSRSCSPTTARAGPHSSASTCASLSISFVFTPLHPLLPSAPRPIPSALISTGILSALAKPTKKRIGRR
jgi:hypothetical protein